ncbi:uncharacterized protein [Palaemon carinicauda]|uniref:uncharacterized protein n=1 Tax=Palaemon carinicauda TaxID=392227 RepID=UPI0035B62EB7
MTQTSTFYAKRPGGSKTTPLIFHWVTLIFLLKLLCYPMTLSAHQSTELTKRDVSQIFGNTEHVVNLTRRGRIQRVLGSNCISVNSSRMKWDANENDIIVPHKRKGTLKSTPRRNSSPKDEKINNFGLQITGNEAIHKNVPLMKLTKEEDSGSTTNMNIGNVVTPPLFHLHSNHGGGYRSSFYQVDFNRDKGNKEINDTQKQTRTVRISPTSKLDYSITRSNETGSQKAIDADSNHHHRREISSTDDQLTLRTRTVRSSDEAGSRRTGILPDDCDISWSCSERMSRNISNIEFLRLPCQCDADCVIYGDCCKDAHASSGPKLTNGDSEEEENGKGEVEGLGGEEETASANDKGGGGVMKGRDYYPPTSWTCGHLTPSKTRQVYMVNKCPKHTPTDLANKCQRISVGNDPQLYLMDIPVVSQMSDIVYVNEFCAKCHNDFAVKMYNVIVSCTGNITSMKDLSYLAYHLGEFTWSERNTETNYPERPTLEKSDVKCSLGIQYDDIIGRQCELGLIESCKDGWGDKDTQIQCSSYNYYVTVGRKVYKNWHCALCNNEPDLNIKCLPQIFLRPALRPVPSLTNLFSTSGQCEENQVWNMIYSRCENVSCGSRFTLKEGKCVRNNDSLEDGNQSFLNSTCYTREFQRNDSIVFPNGSVYVNQTKTTYVIGEYELVNDTWIKVCRPADMWSPVMNIISTVLISISLICMVFHMIIFILLPKRRNIPSMNLCSMTLSLFVSELVFITLFYLNESYHFCVAVAVIIYYFLTSSFMWMNVMSIDICRTFHSKTYKTKSRKIFIQYSIYAWCAPMVATILALLIDQFASSDFILNPRFGTQRCWFNRKWGLVTFFTLPSGLIIFMNLLLFAVSVYDIYKQHKSGEFASATVQRNGNFVNKMKEEKEKFLKSTQYPDPNLKQMKISTTSYSESPRCAERFRDRIQKRIHANKKQRVRLVLYCKLALIMGLTWIFAFVSFHTENLVFEYLFIIFNGLQGTFIFIAFDCKQKVWDEMYTRITGKRIERKGTLNSSNTRETTATSSIDGQYKYRWSSSRNQDGSRKSSPIPPHGQVEE